MFAKKVVVEACPTVDSGKYLLKCYLAIFLLVPGAVDLESVFTFSTLYVVVVILLLKKVERNIDLDSISSGVNLI